MDESRALHGVSSRSVFRATEAPQHRSPLLSLADELVLSIIEQIDTIQALRNFVLTCQKARNRAEPYVYRQLVFRNGEAVNNYTVALSQDLRRGKYAVDLDVRYKAELRHGIDDLNVLAQHMPHLRNWRIESPCPNDSLAFNFTGNFQEGAGVIEYWKHIPTLAHLQTIHLHTHVRGDGGKSYFDLANGLGAAIFKSQSLRRIFLSCSDITSDSVRTLRDYNDKTPLETLQFEECNISVDALKLILSLPKALKRLTLGERLHHFHEPTSCYLSQAGRGFADALALQANSLQYLKQTQRLSHVLLNWSTFSFSNRKQTFCLPHELPQFPALIELDVPFGSPLQSITATLPPRLEKIRIHRVHERIPTAAMQAITRELGVFGNTSLRHLEIVMLEHRTDRADTEEAWLNELIGPEEGKSVLAYADKRVEIWDLGRRLKQNEVRLTINWIRSAGYIPPYMDGEILPTEFTIYDSNSPDIFGHIPSGNIIRDTTCQERLQERGSAAAHEHSESDSVNDDDDDVFTDPFLG